MENEKETFSLEKCLFLSLVVYTTSQLIVHGRNANVVVLNYVMYQAETRIIYIGKEVLLGKTVMLQVKQFDYLIFILPLSIISIIFELPINHSILIPVYEYARNLKLLLHLVVSLTLAYSIVWQKFELTQEQYCSPHQLLVILSFSRFFPQIQTLRRLNSPMMKLVPDGSKSKDCLYDSLHLSSFSIFATTSFMC